MVPDCGGGKQGIQDDHTEHCNGFSWAFESSASCHGSGSLFYPSDLISHYHSLWSSVESENGRPEGCIFNKGTRKWLS